MKTVYFKGVLMKDITYKDGKLYRKGKEIGSPNYNTGYYRVSVDKKIYGRSRLVWILHNGPIPEGMEVCHINGVRHDDRIENLKLCTSTERIRNRSMLRNNKSGIVGVHRKGKKWVAGIYHNKKLFSLGQYDDIQDAALARRIAERIFYA
jgi:hypothetical protein